MLQEDEAEAFSADSGEAALRECSPRECKDTEMGMQVGGQIWHPALGLKSLGSKFSLIREGRVSVGVCRMGLSPGILHQPWAFRPQEVRKRPRRSTSLQGRKRRSVKGQLGSEVTPKVSRHTGPTRGEHRGSRHDFN